MLITVIYFTIESQDFKLLHEYKESKIEAEKEDKAKTAFLVNMSHEIRTPMNAILGMSRLGEDVATEESVVSYFKDINASGNYLLGLINDILDMSRIEQGKMDIINKYEI